MFSYTCRYPHLSGRDLAIHDFCEAVFSLVPCQTMEGNAHGYTACVKVQRS